MPVSFREYDLPAFLSGEQRSNHHAIAYHVLIVYRMQPLVAGRVQYKRPKWRYPVIGIALKCCHQVRDKLHAPADNLATASFQLLPIVEKSIGVVERPIGLFPWRILHVPAVNLR